MPCSQNPLGKENIHCRVKIEIRRIVRQVWFDHACSQEEREKKLKYLKFFSSKIIFCSPYWNQKLLLQCILLRVYVCGCECVNSLFETRSY